MRANKIAVTVLIILAFLIFANSLYIGKITDGIIDKVEAIDTSDPEGAVAELEELFSDYRRAAKIISISVSHDDLTNIEENFADVIGAARAGDSDGLTTVKSRLIDSLGHLRRLSGISLESII